VPGKHKYQTEYTEFYPYPHGSPPCLNSWQFTLNGLLLCRNHI